ncbi:hypothetical protein K439DRAFT_1364374 [Ramaria rubella]|nr:hypothetical protein K439DRAFT_1364374 [Ramaria rubella]
MDLTAARVSPPLPLPLTTRPLGPRTNSPASSLSSRSSRGGKVKRSRLSQQSSATSSPAPIQPIAGPSHLPIQHLDAQQEALPWQEDSDTDPEVPLASLTKAKHDHGQKNAVAGPSKASTTTRSSSPQTRPSTPPPSNLLSTHTCPICFSTVTNACLTPCGHVLCGACLFASVQSGIKRALDMGVPIGGDGTTARCPVCRAVLKGWDGRGGGIIPLKIRTVMAL